MRRMIVKKAFYLLVLSFLFSSVFAVSDQTLSGIFAHLYDSLNKIYPVLIGLCYVIGIFFIGKALFMLKKHGYKTAFMNADSSIIGPMVIMLVGVILMYTPGFLNIMFMTLYGQKVQPTGSWMDTAKAGGGDQWYSALVPMVGLVQVLGLIAFIRGWILVVKGAAPGSQPGNVSKGAMHILGGILAINITGTIDIINCSIGVGGAC